MHIVYKVKHCLKNSYVYLFMVKILKSLFINHNAYLECWAITRKWKLNCSENRRLKCMSCTIIIIKNLTFCFIINLMNYVPSFYLSNLKYIYI